MTHRKLDGFQPLLAACPACPDQDMAAAAPGLQKHCRTQSQVSQHPVYHIALKIPAWLCLVVQDFEISTNLWTIFPFRMLFSLLPKGIHPLDLTVFSFQPLHTPFPVTFSSAISFIPLTVICIPLI